MKKQEESIFDKINNGIKTSVSIKLLSIGLLIAILLIPNSMIKTLITERQASQFEAVREVSEKWAEPLELVGPVLTIPFERQYMANDTQLTSKHYAHFLPATLNIEGDLNPQIRKRGIYEVVVYNTELALKGNFSQIDFKDFNVDPKLILWDEAMISIGIPDMSGIQSDMQFEMNEIVYRMQPGIPASLKLDLGQTKLDSYGSGGHRSLAQQTGVNTKVAIDPEIESLSFGIDLDINGTKTLSFNPVGKATSIKLKSTWQHPSFDGQFLPDSHEITDNGFTAEWSVFDLNRNYPQQWVDDTHAISNSDFGITLFQPVDNYQQNTRSAKYAVLILFLTFITFFFIEVLNKKRIHPIQYVLVGLALTVFYTLLLSLSEHLGFTNAYWIAATIIIAMLSLYSNSILKSKRLAALMLVFFSLIYSFIFIILRMEDFSLLVGSFGLLLVLGLAMYMSRKVDWYHIKTKEELTHA